LGPASLNPTDRTTEDYEVKDSQHFDIIVIGAGPGGYVAAIRAAQLGFSVAMVEKRETLGGTCLNIGCIPSKALLDSSELFAKTNSELSEHGIGVETVTLDVATMQKRKQSVVDRLTGGVAKLMKARKITVLTGTARLADGRTVIVTGHSEETITGKHIILATGSESVELPFLKFDGKTVVSSTEALGFESVPKDLVVVGAGAIGLELGSVWNRLGSAVTIVEIMTEILPGWDAGLARTLRRELTKQGMRFKLGHKVTSVKPGKGRAQATVTVSGPNDEAIELKADKVLVAVGRKPYTKGLGLEAIGVVTEERSGRVTVDDHYQTSVSGVYAIGDIIPGPMLAHKAEEEGVAVAEIIAGKPGHVNDDAIPGVVYTWPEAAFVGRTEEQLRNDGIPFRAGSFNFAANGRALAMTAAGGFVKLLADERTDRLLGAHIVGPWASDLIGELVTVIEFGGSAKDIARTVHAHPTLAEAVKEAALAVDGRSIHSL
jgi:dihydrolipoyl dehydrogenase